MSATDELRRLLDGRGVEHKDFDMPDRSLTLFVNGEHDGAYTENSVNTILTVYGSSPEQAIEATLGSDLKAENAKLRELVRDIWAVLWTCNQYACKHGKDGCYTEDGDNGGKCALCDRMRELGVDA